MDAASLLYIICSHHGQLWDIRSRVCSQPQNFGFYAGKRKNAFGACVRCSWLRAGSLTAPGAVTNADCP